MKQIIKYVSNDGTEFDDAAQCEAYENLCSEIALIMEPWPEVLITGEGYLQQDKETVLTIQRAMVEIFEREHFSDAHTAWAHDAVFPAGMTLIGRYVDDSGSRPERMVWGRIQKLDKKFRQYEQPFYAIQADKYLP
jgi:hypothetical protein